MPQKPADETIKETFESIIIAFILAFVFRAYVVEAFVIPTGSMAPTLLGQHLRVTCVQCGYTFTMDGSDGSRSQIDAICPMCHFPNVRPAAVRRSAGDRILVHKWIYSLTEPRRWDVVVFKAPHDPQQNFIKRLVGLPEEELALFEGNIYVRPLRDAPQDDGDGDGDGWRIARKTDPQANPRWQRIQRTIWQPIYHSQYVPLDHGQSIHDRSVQHPWSTPWRADEPQDWGRTVRSPRASDPPGWLINNRSSYRYDLAEPGAIHFDFQLASWGGPGLYTYNQIKERSDGEPIEDIRLAASFRPDEPGLSIELATTARLDDPDAGPVPLIGRIDAEGRAALVTVDPQSGQERVLPAAGVGDAGPFPPGQWRRAELWYVDQEASLWIDGKPILRWGYDLPMAQILNRRPADPRPQVSIRVAGSPVTLDRVHLDRDLNYRSTLPSQVAPGRGGLVRMNRHPDEQPVISGQPVALAADEFFCLGDNSPQSSDSRHWDKTDPWIHARMFYPDHPMPNGIVPRKLMMGRAFFVYFPAPFAWHPRAPGVFPNFGDMRFIH